MDVFGDFGFAGGFDQAPNPYQDNQSCINWYPEMTPNKTGKVAVALLGAPGLLPLVSGVGGSCPTLGNSWATPSSVTNLPVRGAFVLQGATQALVVIANTCYLVTIKVAGSSTTPGTLLLTKVGTLQTSAGYVSICDNGLGGEVVIVDGPCGYFYNIAAQSFKQITATGFLGASTVCFIDGWWVFSQPNTETFYTNAQPYALTFNASYFANADAATGLLMGAWAVKEALWLLKEHSTEIWYNAGGQYFPFQRLVGTMMQIGCKATGSIARCSTNGQDGLIWFGRNERGENIIVKTAGFQSEVVSTPAVSDAIAKYTVTSDAIGYTYQEDGHEFYVLTFPTADATWVYDASVPPEYSWTQRLSYDPYAQQLHRHRSNCYMNFGGMRIVGDYQNGTLHQLTRAAYSDAGWPLLARRRAPHIWDKGPRGRVFMSSLQVEFGRSQGTSTGLGQNPLCNLRVSRDGTTFGQQWPALMGQIGQYTNRTMWRRLGLGRDNLVEIEVIAPVNRDVTGATLKMFTQASAS